MNAMELLLTRRSVRQFTDREKLRAMEAAVDTAAPRESRYDESCVHWNGWA